MKIDWKALSKTKGYMSLKAAYIQTAQRAGTSKYAMREKAEMYRTFKKVIGLAQHHSLKTDVPIARVLELWEESRGYSWESYYGYHFMPKVHSGSRKPMGMAGLKKHYRRALHNKPSNNYICTRIMQHHKEASTKKPKRWTANRKYHVARMRKYHAAK